MKVKITSCISWQERDGIAIQLLHGRALVQALKSDLIFHEIEYHAIIIIQYPHSLIGLFKMLTYCKYNILALLMVVVWIMTVVSHYSVIQVRLYIYEGCKQFAYHIYWFHLVTEYFFLHWLPRAISEHCDPTSCYEMLTVIIGLE